MSAPHTKRYDALQKLLHWSIAGMIVLQFVLAKLAERADDSDARLQQLALLANHKSVGITILLLAVVRLGWRALRGAPPLPAAMPRWQARASHVSHIALYALLFALPLSGWLMSSASAYAVSWFGVFQLPDLIAADADLKLRLEDLHKFLAQALFVIAAIHIVAALKHALVDRDGVLSRISSPLGLLAFVLVVAGGVAALGRLNTAPQRPAAERTQPAAGDVDEIPDPTPVRLAPRPANTHAPTNTPAAATPAPPPAPVVVPEFAPDVAPTTAPATPEPPPTPAPVASPEPAPPAVWTIDPARSRITFSAEQAGARFTGRWQSWQAVLRFDPARPQTGSFDVTVAVESVATGDAERDGYLLDPEWFDYANFPHATFSARRFARRSDGGWRASGEFRAKGTTTPLTLDFTLDVNGDQRVLRGNARIDRLAAGIGTGEWTDIEWVGRFVDVGVEVFATAR